MNGQNTAGQCRQDGRCQYAIDHGAEGLGACPVGQCCMTTTATGAAHRERREAACTLAFEGIDTKAIEALAAKGGVLELARKAEKAALHLAAALHENAMLRETIERLKP